MYSELNLSKEIKKTSKILDKEIISTCLKLEDILIKSSNQSSLKSEILFVGSTNPSRLTAIWDETNPNLFPIDFDIAILTNEYDNYNKLLEFKSKLPFKSKIYREFGKFHLDFILNNFEINLSFNSPYSNSDPIIYSNKSKILSENERLEIKKAKLIAMRYGIYGGFQKGLKGIMLEQSILKYNSLSEILNHLNEINFEQNKFKIEHPNGKDLIKTISSYKFNILKNIYYDLNNNNLSNKYLYENKFKELSNKKYNISFDLKKSNNLDIYLKINRLISKVSKNIDKEVFIQPSLKSKKVFISFNSELKEYNQIIRRLNI